MLRSVQSGYYEGTSRVIQHMAASAYTAASGAMGVMNSAVQDYKNHLAVKDPDEFKKRFPHDFSVMEHQAEENKT